MGSIGSLARDSTHTKEPEQQAPATANPTICGEVHGYSTPPQLVMRIRQVEAAAITAMPR
jgi:hypothetical protein